MDGVLLSFMLSYLIGFANTDWYYASLQSKEMHGVECFLLPHSSCEIDITVFLNRGGDWGP